MVSSVTMKSSSQGGGIQASSSSKSLVTLSDVHSVFSNRDLLCTSGSTNDNSHRLYFGSLFNTSGQQLSRGYVMSATGVFLRKSLALRVNIVNPDEKNPLNYTFMFIHRIMYITDI